MCVCMYAGLPGGGDELVKPFQNGRGLIDETLSGGCISETFPGGALM